MAERGLAQATGFKYPGLDDAVHDADVLTSCAPETRSKEGALDCLSASPTSGIMRSCSSAVVRPSLMGGTSAKDGKFRILGANISHN